MSDALLPDRISSICFSQLSLNEIESAPTALGNRKGVSNMYKSNIRRRYMIKALRNQIYIAYNMYCLQGHSFGKLSTEDKKSLLLIRVITR